MQKLDSYTIQLEQQPNAADMDTVRQQLESFNENHVGETSWKPFAIFVRDEQNTIVGGLIGGTFWGWLYVDILWIADHVRHHGYGSQLLALAEQEAITRGCTYANLETMDWQARPFYERLGYTVWGELDDIPAGTGHKRFSLRKQLAAQGSVADDQNTVA